MAKIITADQKYCKVISLVVKRKITSTQSYQNIVIDNQAKFMKVF